MRAKPPRKAHQSTTLLLVLASMAVHGLFGLVFSGIVRELQPSHPLAARAQAEGPAPSISYAYACTVDVSAQAAAQLAFCATPFADFSDTCDQSPYASLRNELILCEMQRSDLPALADIEPAEIRLIDAAALAKIKPEPLLPAVPEKDLEEVAKLEEKKIEEKHEEAKREELRTAASAQIVEITQPTVESRPDNARFVSEFDSKVEKEKVARASTDKMVARPGAKKVEPKEQDDTPKVFRPAEEQADSGKLGTAPGKEGREGQPGLLAMRGPEARSTRLDRLGVLHGAELTGSDGLERLRGGDRARTDVSPQTGGAGGEGGEGGDGGARIPNLRPSQDMLEKMVGGGSVDKLDGVEQGIETALNSRRWKYASFFNRMKRRVAQNWHPAEVYMQRDPTGRVYGSKDRLTVLRVSLTPTGGLAKLIVVESSGVAFLDDEAKRAFRAAQPFPNPPAALVEPGDQLITFSFGFHFQIDGPSDSWWKFRRY